MLITTFFHLHIVPSRPVIHSFPLLASPVLYSCILYCRQFSASLTYTFIGCIKCLRRGCSTVATLRRHPISAQDEANIAVPQPSSVVLPAKSERDSASPALINNALCAVHGTQAFSAFDNACALISRIGLHWMKRTTEPIRISPGPAYESRQSSF